MKSEIRYRSAGGQIVTWTKVTTVDPKWPDRPEHVGSYMCAGCGKTDRAAKPDHADAHAQSCRAI